MRQMNLQLNQQLLAVLTKVGDSVQENTSSIGLWSGSKALETIERPMTAARETNAV